MKPRQRTPRTARTLEAMGKHQPSLTRASYCKCGFRIQAGDSQEDHMARAIVSRLFDTYNPDVDSIDHDYHRPGPDNIRTHRAFGEPLCDACEAFLGTINARRTGLQSLT